MSVYVMGDLHLPGGHNKPMGIFGSRWNDHPEKIKKRWTALVNDSDTVVIPGDFSWAMSLTETLDDFRFLTSLPGKQKIMSKGNHDYWWSSVSRMDSFLAENGITGVSFLNNNAYEADGMIICGSRGWFIDENLQAYAFTADYDKLVNRECARIRMSVKAGLELRGERNIPLVLMLHFPPVFGAFVCEPILNTISELGIENVYFGHIHGDYSLPQTTEYGDTRYTLVSADYLDFYPYKITL